MATRGQRIVTITAEALTQIITGGIPACRSLGYTEQGDDSGTVHPWPADVRVIDCGMDDDDTTRPVIEVILDSAAWPDLGCWLELTPTGGPLLGGTPPCRCGCETCCNKEAR